MNFRKNAIRLIGAPIVLSMISTPLLASTQAHLSATPTTTPSMSIELIMPEFAQVGGNDIGGGGAGNDDGGGFAGGAPSGPSVSVSNARTTQIVNQLNQIQQICEFMGDEYRISCFATTYREIAKEIPGNGDYAETKKVLLDTARKLDRLARRNIDRQKPALKARLTTDSGQTVTTPAISPVRSANAAQLNREASNIVAEAETVLLRSASSDATRAIHFQRIAAAVGSNKVLLRSS